MINHICKDLCQIREHSEGFQGGSSGTESTYQCRRQGFDPWVGKIPWRRAWQPTPVFWPGNPQGQGSLVGCSPWGCKGSDTTEQLNSNNRGSRDWDVDTFDGGHQPTTCSQAVSSGVECRVLAPSHHTGAGLEPALSPLPCPGSICAHGTPTQPQVLHSCGPRPRPASSGSLALFSMFLPQLCHGAPGTWEDFHSNSY